MAGAVKPAPRAIFTLRSSGVIVVHAWRSLVAYVVGPRNLRQGLARPRRAKASAC
jgi:hypothetical protein